eukprot:TRINITY_DN2124_c0_g1_i1.p1 TRINITY_DN2124_c0_g1~~TRINITY_DN2124_c0_g1_i1.p1  ORF type:complete len:395 (+),score=67.39 TRINITY_DN2124_c0_g1_i1:124-1185(+)
MKHLDISNSLKMSAIIQNEYKLPHDDCSSECDDSLESIIKVPMLARSFRRYLVTEYCDEILDFYFMVEKYRDETEHKKQVYEMIMDTYLTEGSPREINVPFSLKKRIIDKSDALHDDLFNHVQEHVYNLLNSDAKERFINTETYLSLKDYVKRRNNSAEKPTGGDACSKILLNVIDIVEGNEWDLIENRNGIALSESTTLNVLGDQNLEYIRGDTLVNLCPEQVMNMFLDLSKSRTKWDKKFIKSELIQELSENMQIVHFEFKKFDQVLFRSWRLFPEGHAVISYRSMNRFERPEMKDKPRVVVKLSGILFQPEINDTTRITVMYQMEEKVTEQMRKYTMDILKKVQKFGVVF